MAVKPWQVALAVLAAGVIAAMAGAARLLPAGPADEQAASVIDVGGPFRLTSHRGTSLSDRDLAGSPYAVFFGFTNCPEVCPTTLWEMSEALKALGDDADALKVLFVSVDPGRDKPEHLASYLQSFDPRIIGLTGTEDEIASVARAYRVYWRKVATADGGYTLDHTASVYLMDAEGRFVDAISYKEEAKSRLAKLQRLVRG